MVDALFRNTIGVKNPYAVAELKLRRKINWEKKSPENKVRILEKVFERPYGNCLIPDSVLLFFPKGLMKNFQG